MWLSVKTSGLSEVLQVLANHIPVGPQAITSFTCVIRSMVTTTPLDSQEVLTGKLEMLSGYFATHSDTFFFFTK